MPFTSRVDASLCLVCHSCCPVAWLLYQARQMNPTARRLPAAQVPSNVTMRVGIIHYSFPPFAFPTLTEKKKRRKTDFRCIEMIEEKES